MSCAWGFYFALLAAAAREVTRYRRASRKTAVLDERRRIARDLHDGLAQVLAFIVRRAKRTLEKGIQASDVTQIANAAERALDESRRVIATLTRPLDEPLDVVLSEAVKGGSRPSAANGRARARPGRARLARRARGARAHRT
jgi:signal transduction histidine kinase